MNASRNSHGQKTPEARHLLRQIKEVFSIIVFRSLNNLFALNPLGPLDDVVVPLRGINFSNTAKKQFHPYFRR
jgi:hypothetical protein